MKSAAVSDHVPPSADDGRPQVRLVRWAAGLSAVFGVATLTSITTFAVGYAVGGRSAIEDNWVAYLGGAVALVGLMAALAAFVLAIVSTVKGERWGLLWVPLCAFPACVAFLVLGEAFWWE